MGNGNFFDKTSNIVYGLVFVIPVLFALFIVITNIGDTSIFQNGVTLIATTLNLSSETIILSSVFIFAVLLPIVFGAIAGILSIFGQKR